MCDVIFADTALVVHSFHSSQDPKDIQAAIRTVSRGDVGYGTSMATGLEPAGVELKGVASEDRLQILLGLTDGKVHDADECLRYAEKMAARGVVVCGLGFGTEWDENFLNKFSSYSNRRAVWIEKPQEAIQVFQACTDEVRDATISGARLSLRFLGDHRACEAWTVSPQMSYHGPVKLTRERRWEIDMGLVAPQRPASLLLSVTHPRHMAGKRKFAEVELNCHSPGAGEITKKADLVVEYTDSEAKYAVIDRRVLDVYKDCRIEAYRKKGSDFEASGNRAQAARMYETGKNAALQAGREDAARLFETVKNDVLGSASDKAAKLKLSMETSVNRALGETKEG